MEAKIDEKYDLLGIDPFGRIRPKKGLGTAYGPAWRIKAHSTKLPRNPPAPLASISKAAKVWACAPTITDKIDGPIYPLERA